jgi:hypothetical protein
MPMIQPITATAMTIRQVIEFALLLSLIVTPRRAFPHSKTQSAGCRATAQLRHLAISRTSIRRKRHESAISAAMKR